MSSDNVSILSYTTNITAGSTIYTDKSLLGQYISLSITVSADKDLTIVTQSSGDGSHWDYSVNHNYTALANQTINTPVLAKWTRLSITNNSLSDTTYLRVIVYGVPNNSSISAQITKIGNLDPAVSVSNLPPSYPNSNTRLNYSFYPVNTSLTNANTIYTPYLDLQVSHSGAGVTGQVTGAGAMLNLISNNSLETSSITGVAYPLNGNEFMIRFGAVWTFTSNSNLGGTALIGCQSFYGDKYAFGFNGTLNYANWGIYTTVGGTPAFIPRTSFNVDKCDGTLFVPSLTLTNLQEFQIRIGPDGNYVDFFVMYANVYYLVHRLYYSGNYTTPLMRERSLGLWLNISIDPAAVVSTGNLAVATPHWSMMELGGAADIYQNIYNIKARSYTKASVGAEVVVANFRNYTVFNGLSVFKDAVIKRMSINWTAGVATIINVYLNSTLTAPAFGTISNYSNLQDDVVGTVSVYGQLLKTSYVQASAVAVPVLFQDLLIKSGDIITVTVTNAGTVYMAIEYL